MAMNSVKKDKVTLAYNANLKRLRAEWAIVSEDALNAAESAMRDDFKKALSEGRILEIEGSRKDMMKFLRQAVDNELPEETPRRALKS